MPLLDDSRPALRVTALVLKAVLVPTPELLPMRIQPAFRVVGPT